MLKFRPISVILILAALLAAQFAPALAAPAAQGTTPVTGTVESVVIETDPVTGQNTVLVTIVVDAATGATQTTRVSVDTAVTLGLVSLDPATNQPVVTDTAVGSEVTIDPTLILPDPTVTEEDQHPVGSALADFFGELLGVDYATIMETHEDGVGFGVIAQALWMTRKLEGDSAVFTAIIDAKQSGDYSAITLPDGSTPTNWGQFRKAVLDGDKKSNLGQIMSGHATSGEEEGTTTQPSSGQHGNGHGNNKDKNKGHGNGRGPK